MNRPIHTALCSFLLTAFALGGIAAEGQSRRWTSSLGGVLMADLVGVDGDLVALRRADGAGTISLPLARLSEADRDYVKTGWAIQRLSSVVIPEVSFDKLPLETALRSLEESSAVACPTPPRIRLRLGTCATNAAPVTLQAKNVQLIDALKRLAALTAMQIDIDGTTVLLKPTQPLPTRASP